ncbi:hypothetical protein OO013_18680 [Mangrovivirga sp. M17]|uniref:Uncharacterized protein n=1 Tax=Mangrovivirga halotolerans TaxID=2993936 RepID=A0ABT3RVV4_9BACT|nr:hypothetical protein [Mangrovivirga halotolerans]MCX2745913.1 hypothetical protein [Mangrovivirga halotolerans]
MGNNHLRIKYYILDDPLDMIHKIGQPSSCDLSLDNYSGNELSVHLVTLMKEAEIVSVIIENQKASESVEKDLFKFIRILKNHRAKIDRIEYSRLSEKSEALIKKICSNIIKKEF